MNKDQLRDDIREVLNKHGIVNASICGTALSGEFMGYLGISNPTTDGNVFESIMNTGRLWQHARTVARDMLNDYEGPAK